MQIPKEIKQAIIKAGKYNTLSTINNEIVRDWLEQHAPKELLWEDYLIDSIEQPQDDSKRLIRFLESDGTEI